MFVETGRLTEALLTQRTFVRSMFFVDMQYVNAQTIALLKRSAQRHSVTVVKAEFTTTVTKITYLHVFTYIKELLEASSSPM